jgi:SHS2 domain-containing protein
VSAGGAGGGEYTFVDAVTSDLSFTCRAKTLEALFGAAAEALLEATLGERAELRGEVRRELALEEPDLELLLLAFANELVYRRDAEGLLLRPEHIEIDPGPPARLRGTCAGERVGSDGRSLALDVKAATAYGLHVAPCDAGWQASLTLDV